MAGWRKGLAASLIPFFVGLASPKDISSGTNLSYDGSDGGELNKSLIDKDEDGVAEKIFASLYAKSNGEKDKLVELKFVSGESNDYDAVFNVYNQQGKFVREDGDNKYLGLTGNWINETYKIDYRQNGNVSIDYNAIVYSSNKDKVSNVSYEKLLSPDELAEKQSESVFSKMGSSENLENLLEERNEAITNLPFSVSKKPSLVDKFCKSEQVDIVGKFEKK